MNKKIYFNDKFIEFGLLETQSTQNQAIKIYMDYEKKGISLKNIIDDFIDDKNKLSVQVVSSSLTEVFDALKKMFYYIEAAGGFIEKENEFLFIHRHGRWDLPKGKLEKGETIENAAVRECEEECGVKNLTIVKPLSSTYHIYKYKKGFALKQSYWFYMTTNYSEMLVPQIEESIDEVKWFSKEKIRSTILSDTYFTISDVVNEALML